MNQIASDTINKLKKIGRILDSIPKGSQRIHAAACLLDSFTLEFGDNGFKEALFLAEVLKKDRESQSPADADVAASRT